jgi:dephospho-CoA kinase
VWMVTCSPEEQRQRLVRRGYPADEIERRIAAQGADLADRLRPHVTRVIDASGSIVDTTRRAGTALHAAFRDRGEPHARKRSTHTEGSANSDS